MSHFVIAVLTQTGSEEEVAKLMAPYHEFECTGRDDEYVQDIDITQEAWDEYKKHMSRMLKSENGTLVDRYDDRFYRYPTEEEKATIGPIAGTGGNGKISWTSKDWGDGRGYQTKVHFVPEGWVEDSVPTEKVMGFADFIEYQYGIKKVQLGDKPDLSDTHKYGYILLSGDATGQGVTKAINRTNPNKFWDWYVIGGRWDNYFFQGNRCKVSEFPAWPDEWKAPNKFFGLITPDGVYHSKGRGGWWGAVLDEKDDWHETEAKLLSENQDAIAVVVDFHI